MTILIIVVALLTAFSACCHAKAYRDERDQVRQLARRLAQEVAMLEAATPAKLRDAAISLEQHRRSLERFERLRRAEHERVSLN